MTMGSVTCPRCKETWMPHVLFPVKCPRCQHPRPLGKPPKAGE